MRQNIFDTNVFFTLVQRSLQVLKRLGGLKLQIRKLIGKVKVSNWNCIY